MNKPNLFIVGAPRSGTTSLYHYLNEHPDIFMSPKKEPHYFATDLSSPTQLHKIYRNKKTYIKLFEGASSEKYLGEASVYYLYSTMAAKNIKAFNPDSKIIIILRSPVDAIQSLYQTNRFSGQEQFESLEDALEAEKSRKSGKNYIKDLNFLKESFLYTEIFKYYKQVKRYTDIFDNKNIHIILFSRFDNDTALVYKNVLKFLEIDNNFLPKIEIHNKSMIPRNRLIQKHISNLIIHPLQQSGLYTLIPENILLAMKSYMGKTDNSKTILNNATRARLSKLFIEDIQNLERLIKIDLSSWYK